MEASSATDLEVSGSRGAVMVRRWDPEGDPGHVVLLAHGYGEHSGRYEHVASRLTADGAVVYAPDHYGHGRSDGERAVVDSIEDMAGDLAAVEALAREAHPSVPFVLIGHSLGGLISTRFVQTRESELAALVLSGPVVAGNPKILPLMEMDPIPEVPIDPATLSRDPAVGEAYAADPLIYHGPFARETLEEFGAAIQRVAEGPGFGALPALWIHGELDSLAPYGPTLEAMEHLRGAATEEAVYPGAMHEIFNETNQDEVLDDVSAFVARAVTQDPA